VVTEKVREVKIKTESIALDQFLKWAQVVPSGGMAKELIRAGEVMVNGQREDRRSRRLTIGDEIEVRGLGRFRLGK
jgi:ribosome-associated protein